MTAINGIIRDAEAMGLTPDSLLCIAVLGAFLWGYALSRLISFLGELLRNLTK